MIALHSTPVHPRPTAEPVASTDWIFMHVRECSFWYGARRAGHAGDADEFHEVYGVVDDFGDLHALSVDQYSQMLVWLCRKDLEPSAQAHIDRMDAERRRRPPPSPPAPARTVSAEIVTTPPDPNCPVSIVIGADDAPGAPLYSVQFGRSDPVFVTHTQLAALTLATHRLLAETTRTGTLQ